MLNPRLEMVHCQLAKTRTRGKPDRYFKLGAIAKRSRAKG